MLKFLDIFFLVFHSSLILFNLFGWTLKKTRRLNLITLLLTGFSWIGLGLFYGFGYCPFTDWHWQVLDKLGSPVPYHSYIQYLFDRILGLKMIANTADTLTTIAYLIALLCSVFSNFFFKKKKTVNK